MAKSRGGRVGSEEVVGCSPCAGSNETRLQKGEQKSTRRFPKKPIQGRCSHRSATKAGRAVGGGEARMETGTRPTASGLVQCTFRHANRAKKPAFWADSARKNSKLCMTYKKRARPAGVGRVMKVIRGQR